MRAALSDTTVLSNFAHDARQLAVSMGLDLSGTLGCLRDLVKRSILDVSAADLFLARMRERGYRSPGTLAERSPSEPYS